MNIRYNILTLIFWAILILTTTEIFAQDTTNISKGFPVFIETDTLFSIYHGIGGFSPEKRAEEVNNKLLSLSRNDDVVFDSLKIVKSGGMILLTLDSLPILGITEQDAKTQGISLDIMAKYYSSILIDELNKVRSIDSEIIQGTPWVYKHK